MPVGNGWNDVWDGTLDWSGVTFWNRMLAAVHERLLVAATAPGLAAPADVARAAGHDVSTAAGDDFAGPTWALYSVREMQRNIEAVVGSFADKAAAYVGNTDDTPDWALSMDKIFPAGNWWRRRRPREIYSLSATHDQLYRIAHLGFGNYRHSIIDGANARAVGHLAKYYEVVPAAIPTHPLYADYHLTDPHLPRPHVYRGVYRWDGAAWVQQYAPEDPAATFDVLDSDNAPGGGSHVATGAAAASLNPGIGHRVYWGDYLGWWVFDQLRTALKAMVWLRRETIVPYSAADPAKRNLSMIHTGAGPGADWAAAKAAAEADWAANPAYEGTATPPSAWSDGAEVSGSFDAAVARYAAHPGLDNLYAGIAGEVDVYAFPTEKALVAGDTWTFEDNGDPVSAFRQWVKMLTEAAAGGGGHAYANWFAATMIGDATTLPAWVGEPPAFERDSLGYYVGGGGTDAGSTWTAIVRYDVAGGFQYT